MTKLMIVLLNCLFVSVNLYAGVMAYMYVFQRSYTFAPSKADPFESHHAPFQPFTYQNEFGLMLRGLAVPARDGMPTIIYFQGNAGNIADRLYKADYFLPRGYGMVLVGYRGYSGNPGKPSEKGLYDDARSAIRAVLAQGVPVNDIVLYGESLGTAVAVQMAAEFPGVRALILEAPFTSIADVGKRVFWYLPVQALMRDQFDSANKVSRLKMPLLIIHGTDDEVVPYEFGKMLFEKATSKNKKLVTIEHAHHGDLYQFKAGEEINAFLDRL